LASSSGVAPVVGDAGTGGVALDGTVGALADAAPRAEGIAAGRWRIRWSGTDCGGGVSLNTRCPRSSSQLQAPEACTQALTHNKPVPMIPESKHRTANSLSIQCAASVYTRRVCVPMRV
jgi:hypothetical protein